MAERINCFMRGRVRKAERYVSLSEAKGEHREPGLQKNSVRNFIGRRTFCTAHFNKAKAEQICSIKKWQSA